MELRGGNLKIYLILLGVWLFVIVGEAVGALMGAGGSAAALIAGLISVFAGQRFQELLFQKIEQQSETRWAKSAALSFLFGPLAAIAVFTLNAFEEALRIDGERGAILIGAIVTTLCAFLATSEVFGRRKP